MKTIFFSLIVATGLAGSASAQSFTYPFSANNNRAVTFDIQKYTSFEVTGVGQPSHGTLTFTDGTVKYAPDSTFSGLDTFSYQYAIGASTGSGVFAIADVAVYQGTYVVAVTGGGDSSGDGVPGSAGAYFPPASGTMSITATGAFTFRNGLTSTSGQFKLPAGTFSVDLAPGQYGAHNLGFNLGVQGGAPVVTGTYAFGSPRDYSILDFTATKAAPAGADAGRYTVLMQLPQYIVPDILFLGGGGTPPPPAYLNYLGTGWAKMTISARGVISYAGQLNDGTTFTSNAAYGANRTFSVNVSNRLTGSVTFADRPGVSDFGAAATFVAADGSKIPIDFLGSRFVPAKPGKHVLDYHAQVGTANLSFDGGGLTSENGTATIARDDVVVRVKNPVKVLSISGATGGIFSGQFAATGADGKKSLRSFKGVIFQKENAAVGLFRIPTKTSGDFTCGTVTVEPK